MLNYEWLTNLSKMLWKDLFKRWANDYFKAWVNWVKVSTNNFIYWLSQLFFNILIYINCNMYGLFLFLFHTCIITDDSFVKKIFYIVFAILRITIILIYSFFALQIHIIFKSKKYLSNSNLFVIPINRFWATIFLLISRW